MTAGDAVGNFLGLTTGTPLQRTLSKLAVLLFFIALLFAMIVFAANGFKTDKEIVLYAVATGLSMSELLFRLLFSFGGILLIYFH